jgi:hypothetical protein
VAKGVVDKEKEGQCYLGQKGMYFYNVGTIVSEFTSDEERSNICSIRFFREEAVDREKTKTSEYFLSQQCNDSW